MPFSPGGLLSRQPLRDSEQLGPGQGQPGAFWEETPPKQCSASEALILVGWVPMSKIVVAE